MNTDASRAETARRREDVLRAARALLTAGETPGAPALARSLGLPRATVGDHLAALRAAGLLPPARRTSDDDAAGRLAVVHADALSRAAGRMHRRRPEPGTRGAHGNTLDPAEGYGRGDDVRAWIKEWKARRRREKQGRAG
jgi:DNA-binding transcriptional ArsR family regulator